MTFIRSTQGLMWAALAGTLLCGPSWAEAPAAAPSEGYVFPSYANAAQVEAACKKQLAEARQIEQALQSMESAPAAELLARIDALTLSYEDTLGPIAVLNAVHPDKGIRDAADACDLDFQRFSNAFQQNPKVYALLKRAKGADEIDQRLLQDQLDGFEDSGVGLSASRRAKAQTLRAEITRRIQEFDRRVREDKTRVAFTADQLEGVPESVWKDAPRDAEGRYLLGLESPTYEPVMTHATHADTRERIWRAYQRRGGSANLKTLARLTTLRHDYARLFGFNSYADFVLRRRMAKREADLQRFLGTVKDAVAQRELNDIATLAQTKLAQGKVDAASAAEPKAARASAKLSRWDAPYYVERTRQQQFQLDEEQFRPYFPAEASLQFVFKLAEQLFGVHFEAQPQTLWHADARAYVVRDAASQQLIGTLFVDLYPRADKYNHAAVWSFRNVSTLSKRQPAAALVVNFNRAGLTIRELETLLHEFGHALHSLLSTTRYATQGGTNVKLDFVEAPSQMLEEWVYDPKVLALFQQVCASCPPVPEEVLARAVQARDFAKGIYFARQHLYASYDLALYGKDAPSPMSTWSRMEGATPLGHVSGSIFPAAFSHVAGGYAAGYYSYLWSLVLAEDLRTAFTQPDGSADKLNAEVGRRYRAEVLSRGGEVEPAEMMRRFLGRDSNSQAFFKAIKR